MTTRHLYNNKNGVWHIRFAGGSLPDLAGASQQDGIWVGKIIENSNCALEFDANSDNLSLRSHIGTAWSYDFSTNEFDDDPHWDHDRDTNGAKFNDPADGDFQIDVDVPQ